MATKLAYAIKFVSNMEAAVRFYTTRLGLTLRFQSPEWSELDTGQTTLALHLASDTNPAGSCQLGFRVQDVDAFCKGLEKQGVRVIDPPRDVHGIRLAKLRDIDGSEFSVSG